MGAGQRVDIHPGADAGTLLLEHGRVGVLGDFLSTLDPLQRQTAVDVPDDVAVHQPSARIVSFEADDGVSGGGTRAFGASEHHGVTAGRVDEVQGRDQAVVPRSVALTQHAHVVAVQMHGVGSEELVLDDEVHPLVSRAQSDLVGDQRAVAAVREGLQGRLGVVDVDRAVVDEPAEHGAVVIGRDLGDVAGGESRGCGGKGIQGAGRLLEVRNQRRNGFVQANGEVGGTLVAVRGGGKGIRSALILDNTVGVSETSVVAAAGARSLGDGTQEIASHWLVHLDDDIVALADTDVQPLGLVRNYGHIIGGDDSHDMVVEVYRPHVLTGRVDEAEQMFLARLDGPQGMLTG